MRVIVGEGSQSVEFFLSGGVPERELDVHVVNEDVVDVVLEDGWFAGRMLETVLVYLKQDACLTIQWGSSLL